MFAKAHYRFPAIPCLLRLVPLARQKPRREPSPASFTINHQHGGGGPGRRRTGGWDRTHLRGGFRPTFGEGYACGVGGDLVHDSRAETVKPVAVDWTNKLSANSK